MGKLISYTKTTPLPSNIPRQLALDLIQSHREFIQLNKLVTNVQSIDPPQNAEAAEYFGSWYEITEHMNMGLGKLKIVFKGCWTDQPWGVKSHTIMPKAFDMRNSYRIGGNQPGEPRENGVERDGVYLREDISIDCHVPMIGGFVKKEMQSASASMVDRMKLKAELLDKGELLAMFENGKLKTSIATAEDMKPQANRVSTMGTAEPKDSPRFQPVDTLQSQQSAHPVDSKGFARYDSAPGNPSSGRNSYIPAYQQTGYQGPPLVEAPENTVQQGFVSELPGNYYHPYQPPQPQNSIAPQTSKPQQTFRSELPGNMTLPPPPPSTSDRLSLPSQNSYQITNPGGGR